MSDLPKSTMTQEQKNHASFSIIFADMIDGETSSEYVFKIEQLRSRSLALALDGTGKCDIRAGRPPRTLPRTGKRTIAVGRCARGGAFVVQADTEPFAVSDAI